MQQVSKASTVHFVIAIKTIHVQNIIISHIAQPHYVKKVTTPNLYDRNFTLMIHRASCAIFKERM